MQIAQQVREYLKHGVIQNAVNVPSVSAEEYAEMQPYIVLAERMGAVLAESSEGSIEEISLRLQRPYCGVEDEELIRNGAIKGILNQTLDEKANLVNAASLAEDRGLRVTEAHKAESVDRRRGQRALDLLKSSKEEHMVKGAVLRGLRLACCTSITST